MIREAIFSINLHLSTSINKNCFLLKWIQGYQHKSFFLFLSIASNRFILFGCIHALLTASTAVEASCGRVTMDFPLSSQLPSHFCYIDKYRSQTHILLNTQHTSQVYKYHISHNHHLTLKDSSKQKKNLTKQKCNPFVFHNTCI